MRDTNRRGAQRPVSAIAKWTAVILLVLAATGARASDLANAVAASDFDYKNCIAYEGSKPIGPGDPATIGFLFGVSQSAGDVNPQWSTSMTAETTRRFRIAFTHPVAIGTICTEYTGPVTEMFRSDSGRMVAYLKPDAPFPGDVADDSQWVTLPAGMVKVLPPGTAVRALRFTEVIPAPAREGQITQLGQSLLLTGRFYSAVNLGFAKIEMSGGRQPAETHWLGYWNDPQTIDGVAFLGMRARSLRVESIKSTAALLPAIAGDSDFARITDIDGSRAPNVTAFASPVTTNAIRLVLTAGTVLTGNFGVPLPLVDLGQAAEAPSVIVPPAPFKLHFTMPFDGFVAIHVMDKSGKLVRRLVAEVPHAKGAVSESWDLKNDRGEYVQPGTYTWKVLARPPLKLTYEGTVNNSGQPAWWAPPPGKGGGGWLADHGMPVSACAVGDIVFLGSPVAESGNSAIAVDKDGNKLWGETMVLEGFAGADRIATDGKYAYLVNHFGVERVDPANNFARQTVIRFDYSRDLPDSGRWWDPVTSGGAAIFGDKLYVSYNAPGVPWLQSSFLADTVDTDDCMPMVRLDHGRRDVGDNYAYAESEYDELEKLYAAFLTGANPISGPSLPGIGLPSSTSAYFGDAPTNGPLSGTLTISFKKPIALGSVLVPDASVQVYALKPGKALSEAVSAPDPEADVGGADTTDAFDDTLWMPLTTVGRRGGAAIAVTKAGFYTQALRFKAHRLSFAMVMSRRFADVAPDATRVYGDGSDSGSGGWVVSHPPTDPITPLNSPAMALVWKQPVSLRGVSLIRPTTATMLVDAYVGPSSGDPAALLDDDTAWRNVGQVQGEIYRGYFPQHATVRSVDFGDSIETRALRVRATEPDGAIAPQGRIVAVTTAHLAGFDSIVAYTYLGGDPDLPTPLNERITEIQLPKGTDGTGQILRQIPLAKPGYLTFDKSGALYAESDGRIVTVPLTGSGAPVEVIGKAHLDSPAGMTFGPNGLLYIADVGPNVVKVFDVKTGEQVRTIGKPGGLTVGKYDPDHMYRPTGVAIDSSGKLWVAENSYAPKRISRWTLDGTLEKYFTGPTSYGGGGCLDPGDKSVLNYTGMKFIMDWTTRNWKLDSILFIPGKDGIAAAYPDRPFYYKGQRYLAGDDGRGSAVSLIAIEKDGVAVPVAAAGNLGQWADLMRRPAFRAKFGKLQLENCGFIWTDNNGDHVPEPNEIQLVQSSTLPAPYWNARIGEDLSFNFAGCRIRPTSVRADGMPVYDAARLESLSGLNGQSWTTADGRALVLSGDGDRLYAPDGKTVLWFYPDNYVGVQGSHHIGYGRPAGTLVGELNIVGHLNVGGEELFVTNGNHGDWYAFTSDGMLAGCIFGGPGQYGKRGWTMPEWLPGKTDLSDLNVGEEHFGGCVVKAEDGNVYCVAGHNHNSIVRVDGLESMKRITGGPVEVGRLDLDAAQTWAVAKATAERALMESKVAKVPYLSSISVDGSLDDWDDSLFLTVSEVRDDLGHIVSSYQGALAFDSDKLYIAARCMDSNAFNNSSQDLKTLFKSGGAFEVDLGVDPAADPKRSSPAAGDLRLLLARINGKCVAVEYRPVVPGTPDASRVLFRSIADTYMDVVKVIDNPDMVVEPAPGDKDADTRSGTLEAAISWKELGVNPPRIGSKLRGDIGYLIGDQNGVRTESRLYWSGKTQTIVADLASEARLAPSLWGDLYFLEADTHTLQGPDTGGGPGLDTGPGLDP